MKHHIERTSPKGRGQTFIGVCILCGIGGLKLTDTMKDCENVRGLTQEQAIVEVIVPTRRALSEQEKPK